MTLTYNDAVIEVKKMVYVHTELKQYPLYDVTTVVVRVEVADEST